MQINSKNGIKTEETLFLIENGAIKQVKLGDIVVNVDRIPYIIVGRNKIHFLQVGSFWCLLNYTENMVTAHILELCINKYITVKNVYTTILLSDNEPMSKLISNTSLDFDIMSIKFILKHFDFMINVDRLVNSINTEEETTTETKLEFRGKSYNTITEFIECELNLPKGASKSYVYYLQKQGRTLEQIYQHYEQKGLVK